MRPRRILLIAWIVLSAGPARAAGTSPHSPAAASPGTTLRVNWTRKGVFLQGRELHQALTLLQVADRRRVDADLWYAAPGDTARDSPGTSCEVVRRDRGVVALSGTGRNEEQTRRLADVRAEIAGK